MVYIPHERLAINWLEDDKGFTLSLPWVSMEIDVTDEDRSWIKEATYFLHSSPANGNVQRFINELKDYPIFYIKPRRLEAFKGQDLQPCPSLGVDSSTPTALISTFGCDISNDLIEQCPPRWLWEQDKILRKARIPGTRLYDPVSLISYLICYRQEWESTTWSGLDRFGQFLERQLERDEEQFFQAIGWVAKQSWYVTSNACHGMKPALAHFEKAREVIHHYISDEAGHYKFMEQVFRDLNLDKDDFSVGSATKWLLAAHEHAAIISPLAFSAMINLFEAAYYEGEDPISRVVKLSSKPYAAQGYDLHYKINQEHRHCDIPIQFAAFMGPQSYSHALMTVGLFELTLHYLDQMEKELVKAFESRY